jgi:hypothetical protein
VCSVADSFVRDFYYFRSHGITRIVNCTHGESKIPDYHSGKLLYYTFPISHWQLYVNSTNASVQVFTDPLFAYIEEAIANGQNVMVSFVHHFLS